MKEGSQPERRSLTQHHAEVLGRYATAMESQARPRWDGDNVVARHTDEIRDLARRISRCATEGAGTFTKADTKLLSKVGGQLVGSAQRLLTDTSIEPDVRADAQTRLRQGIEILDVQGILAEHMLETKEGPNSDL